MLINGGPGADSLPGTSGDDTINGFGGDDVITSGGGKDTIDAGDDNDTIVLDGAVTNGSFFQGGAGFDTLQLTNLAGAPLTFSRLATAGIVTTGWNLGQSAVNGIERISFQSSAGAAISSTLVIGGALGGANLFNQASNLTDLVGGAGLDILVLAANAGAAGTTQTVTAPTLTYTNWTNVARAYQQGDRVIVIANGNGDVTINGSAHAGIQDLVGGNGNDTLNGSGGMDFLSGGGGANQLHGNGGDDTLSISNGIANDSSGVPIGGESSATGEGSLFDGGADTDFLAVGGNVNFKGTLQSIEGIYLVPSFTSKQPQSSSQLPTVLTISQAQLATTPGNLILDGVGNIIVNLAAGESFNGSAYTFEAGSDVKFSVNGTVGNDTMFGTEKADRFNSILGVDNLQGGDGNDFFVFAASPAGGTTINGGSGTDSIELRNLTGAPVVTSAQVPLGQPTTTVNFFGAGLNSIERIDFQSNAGTALTGQFLFGGDFPDQIGSGLSPAASMVGGAGSDTLFLLAQTSAAHLPYEFNLPTFSYSNWSTPDRAYKDGDRVLFFALGDGTVTLNGSAHAGVQVLVTGSGDDTIIGSDDMDLIAGGDGINVLHGEGGDDGLLAVNVVGNDANGVAGTEGKATYAGNLFDGGDGTDFLVAGGNIDFQGTLESIEGIYLSPSYNNTMANNASQLPTVLTMSGATMGTLPANLILDGTGSIVVNLDTADSFNGAGYTFDPGSNVQFLVNGSTKADTIVGTAATDTLYGGEDSDTLTGGAGADLFKPSLGQDTVTDFTFGADKVDVSEIGITSFAQLQPFMSQAGSHTVVSLLYNGVINTLTLENTTLANLSASDFVFASPTTPVIEFGTEFADTIFGTGGADTLSGLGGNDIIYSGGGKDKINGGSDDDTVVFDTAIAPGTILDGGTGADTLQLRGIAGAPFTQNSFSPGGITVSNFTFQNASYFGQGGSLASFERIDFQSAAGTTMSAQFFWGGQVLDVNGDPVAAPNQIGGGLSATAQLVGGAGHDGVVLIVLTLTGEPYTLTAPSFNYSNWSTAARAYQASDRVYVVIAGDGNVVLDGSDHVGVQHLSTGGGNDTITGTDGMEFIGAGGGTNVIDARGGNDTLSLYNLIATNGAGVAGSEGTETGASTTFNGGDGIDFLSIGGHVNFQGTLLSIEGLHLQAAYTSVLPNSVSQLATVMTVSGATWAQLPANLQIDGAGSVIVNLAGGDTFNGAGYSFDAGSNVNFTVNGSSAADTIVGTTRDDTLNGGDGNDRLAGGGGKNLVSGGNNDDTLVVDGLFTNGSTFAGGDGFDTLELHNIAGMPINPSRIDVTGRPTTGYAFGPSTVTSIEQIDFQSGAGTILSTTLAFGGVGGFNQASSLTAVKGGDGLDLLVLSGNTGQTAGVSTTIDAPNLTYTNWAGAARAYQPGDHVIVLGNGNGNAVINGSSHAGIQDLVGGLGNDTLNGSSDMDYLSGGAGANQLHGNGGDDSLALANGIQNNNLGVPIGGESTQTGAGSLFDGGAGTDFLVIGGNVNFQGTLLDIEGLYLMPAYTSAAAFNSSQLPTNLTMSGEKWAALPAGLILDGVGSVTVNLAATDIFNGSAYTFDAGSNVTFTVNGSTGNDTIIGTANADTLNGDDGDDTLTGGGGADMFKPSFGNDVVSDFTPGADKINLSEVGISSLAQLQPYLSQNGSDATFSLLYDGAVNTLTLNGIAKGSLTANDFLFASATDPHNLTGTENADTLFGGSGADTLNGLGGNDIILPGVGKDTVDAGDGDDTIVFDTTLGLDFSKFGTYNGGAGTDTIELRDTTAGAVTRTGLPLIGYSFFIPGMLNDVERADFVSAAGTEINLFMVMRTVDPVNGTPTVTTYDVVSQADGGAGNDSITFQALRGMVSGETAIYTPTVAVTNWTSNAKSYLSYQTGDEIRLAAGPLGGNYTLAASEANAAAGIVQKLTGNVGNDTLLGSSGADVLDGAGGVNVLKGGGGNDTLLIANTSNNPNGIAFTGAGSTFDGEGGTDFLSIGGVVDFQGTLASIEGLYLQPAFAGTAFGSQTTAQLTISGANMAALASNLMIDGVGSVIVNLAPGDSFNGAGYSFEPGSNVTFTINGSTGDDTITGTSHSDTIDGGQGVDTAVFSGNQSAYTASAGAGGSVIVGGDSHTNVELYKFDDGLFFWDGIGMVSAQSAGTVSDGYVSGATVYIDVNGNGVLDPGEPSTVTDGAGRFSLISPLQGPLRAFGGINIDTNLPNSLDFSAPEGAKVLNPLTTLIQELVEGGDSEAAAEAKVEAAFGLDPSLDLTQLDLIDAAGSDPDALAAQKAAAAVAEVLDAVADAGGSTDDALQNLVEKVDDGGALDLTDAQVLTEVIVAGIPGGSTQQIDDLVAETQAVTEAIEEAEDVDDITNVQGNRAPVGAPDVKSVNEDASASGNILTNDKTVLDPTDHIVVTSVAGTAIAGSTVIAGQYGTLTIDADGNFNYSANGDVLDALPSGLHLTEAFAYQIDDGNGGIADSTLTFDVNTIADLLTIATTNANTVKNYTGADERITAGNGNDTLHGMGGSDRINGDKGNDVLYGDDGWDLLVGGLGNDKLYGGNGEDILAGGQGNDTMFGGAGADVFEFGALSSGNDVIGDFQKGIDHIHLSGGLTVTGMTESAGSTTLALSNGGFVLFSGVTGVGDYHSLLTADLPLWSAGLPMV